MKKEVMFSSSSDSYIHQVHINPIMLPWSKEDYFAKTLPCLPEALDCSDALHIHREGFLFLFFVSFEHKGKHVSLKF